jgi:2,3,4,5-tetrahydropyridine-2-carboxylate N-succinyltransferase
MTVFAFGIGVGTKNKNDNWIEVFYPVLHYRAPREKFREINKLIEIARGRSQPLRSDENFSFEITRQDLQKLGPQYEFLSQTDKPLVATVLYWDRPPLAVPEAYLKLHLLSHRIVKPNTINLEGIFKILPIVAWTSSGPIDASELPQAILEHRLLGRNLEVSMVDKFPRMTDYVVPEGVRIADSARVRLGAYVGPGTTVMQEGFINYNAGTEGPNMVEGRISAGVFVGAGSDLGGGCSTMGTLSGGNSMLISVGKRCLVGANAGLGISLGDDCTVEAGLYVTASSKVTVIEPESPTITLKARDLSGKNNLLFRRNSQSGMIECLKNKESIELNPDLHM